MTGHRHCIGEHVEVHEFEGKNTQQALARLGKWLDKNGGSVNSLTFCDAKGEPIFATYQNTEPRIRGPVFVAIHWQENA